MTIGSYEDAIKAFTNADSVSSNSLSLYQRARCHIATHSLGKALEDLRKVIEMAPFDKIA